MKWMRVLRTVVIVNVLYLAATITVFVLMMNSEDSAVDNSPMSACLVFAAHSIDFPAGVADWRRAESPRFYDHFWINAIIVSLAIEFVFHQRRRR